MVENFEKKPFEYGKPFENIVLNFENFIFCKAYYSIIFMQFIR